MPIAGLKTRKPTGAVPYPCILLEGEEKAGKTWAAALLSASDKVGATYWIDLGEGAADEYGAIPGARYEIVEHDGSYAAIADAVRAVKAEAKRAADAGEKPVVLVVDTGSALWDSLKDWVDTRARKTQSNRKKLAEDPDAEIKAPTNFWNDARSRWNRVMNPLLTFPGIVVVTSQGRETIKMGKDGRPIEGEKTWRVAVQESFPYAVNVWVRMFRDAAPVVVGARSVHLGIVPGKDAERTIKDPGAEGRLLEWLIFDALRCDPNQVTTRDLQELSMGELSEEERVTQDEADQQAAPAAQVGQVVQAAQRSQQQWPRRGAERPADRAGVRTAEQWSKDVAEAATRERLAELHAQANAAGQLTQGLLGAMQARAAELTKKAAEQQASVEDQTPTEEQVAAADAADAASDAARAETDQQVRELLLSELDLIAEIVGTNVPTLTRRITERKPSELPMGSLTELVTMRLRPLAITKLRGTGRTSMAAVYEQFGPGMAGTREQLLGVADKAA
jgi:hypothetical protein